MRKHFFAAITLVAIAILTMDFHCGKDDMSRPFDYQFTATVDIYPLKKFYSLADTIWIETDLPSKYLYDSKSGQSINADTTEIFFRATYGEFGTSITNPPNGFCEIISSNGNIVQPGQSQWATDGYLNYGCGQPSFKCRIGFKPRFKGAYGIFLMTEDLIGNCPLKIKPLYATLALRYKNVDLNLDVFNTLPASVKGDNTGAFYINKINNREMFVVNVQ